MIGLEELELIDGRGMKISEVLVIIRNLSELTTLNLELAGLSAVEMVEIVRCAPKLREFKYCRWIENSTFEESVYQTILNVVSAREPECQLNIILPTRVVCVPRILQKANEHTLKITTTSWEYIEPSVPITCPRPTTYHCTPTISRCPPAFHWR